MALESLTTQFIIKHAKFKSWQCIKFGFERHWLDVEALAWLSGKRLAGSMPDEELLIASDLSGIPPKAVIDAGELLDKLCHLEQKAIGAVTDCYRLWLVLGLLWVRCNEASLDDPLYFAEDVAEDLGRPPESASWLRIMPADIAEWDPSRHSYGENYKRLMQKWKAYLFKNAEPHLQDYESLMWNDDSANALRKSL